jgi:hypothetical protein
LCGISGCSAGVASGSPVSELAHSDRELIERGLLDVRRRRVHAGAGQERLGPPKACVPCDVVSME